MISDFFRIKTIGFKLSFNGDRRVFLIGFIDEFRTESNYTSCFDEYSRINQRFIVILFNRIMLSRYLVFSVSRMTVALKGTVDFFITSFPNIEQSKPYDLSTLLI